MQLGELQSQLERFSQRDVAVLALSVDPASQSRALMRRLGITFKVLSDQDQKVMQAFGVQNPETQALALHAVFIVDDKHRVFYRKVAGRRPKAQELLDAVDYFYGQYPSADKRLAPMSFQREFPSNNFQALIALSAVTALPDSVPLTALADISTLLQKGATDDSVIAFRQLLIASGGMGTQQDYLDAAAVLTRQALSIPSGALMTGRDLKETLATLAEHREAGTEGAELEAQLAALQRVRSTVRQNAGEWKLDYAKSMLRSYRKLVMAEFAD